MASSGNFDTLSPIDNPTYDSTTNVPSQGNLKYTSSGNNQCTAQIPLTFKSYCEVRIVSISNYGGSLGFGVGSLNNTFYWGSVSFQTNYSSGYIYVQNGASGGGSSPGNIGGNVSAGNIVMMAYDPATYRWWVGVNGTWRNSGDPANGTGYVYEGSATQFANGHGNNTDIVWGAYTSSANGLTCVFNFGQDSTFGDLETAGGNADDNGHGDFKYSPPTGFLANCAANMPISSGIDPAQTDDDYPGKQFNAITWTGDGTTSRAITGLGFQPDFIWFKDRTQAFSHRLYDTSRGINSNGGKRLFSNTSGAENDQTSGQDISAVGTDGFTLGASSANYTNYSSDENVAWCWRANGGTTASNTEGSTTSTVQANTKAGFSIIQYAGNSSSGSTIGHGLDSAPDFILFKALSGSENWAVYHRALGGTKAMVLNDSASVVTNSNRFNDTDPSATLITMGNVGNVNETGKNYVAYAWHSVEGYSKFGDYDGNGNSNGPYIRTGFRPRMVFLKQVDGAGEWTVFDTARETHNQMEDLLQWDLSNAETQLANDKIDFLSNGFKLRGAGGGRTNQNGRTFIYGAWGDVPFKYNNTF